MDEECTLLGAQVTSGTCFISKDAAALTTDVTAAAPSTQLKLTALMVATPTGMRPPLKIPLLAGEVVYVANSGAPSCLVWFEPKPQLN
jgi:tetrahydromethanopterin S-methyltransferase subunit D